MKNKKTRNEVNPTSGKYGVAEPLFILDVIRQPDVPLWLLDLLALWLEVKDEPDARQTFEDGFSGLWLRVAKLRREKRLAKSGAS
ncbi:MAG TPA: hypothetical protein VHY84_26700 [Bryobacteraceae bacterium]|jgi:hypothetical protein|nr:hypothetical protein [Bryobacteraceae bacterium]